MTEAEEKREQTIQGLVNLLRISQFDVEFKEKKKPAGIKITIEVTQEQMDVLADKMIKEHKEE